MMEKTKNTKKTTNEIDKVQSILYNLLFVKPILSSYFLSSCFSFLFDLVHKKLHIKQD